MKRNDIGRIFKKFKFEYQTCIIHYCQSTKFNNCVFKQNSTMYQREEHSQIPEEIIHVDEEISFRHSLTHVFRYTQNRYPTNKQELKCDNDVCKILCNFLLMSNFLLHITILSWNGISLNLFASLNLSSPLQQNCYSFLFRQVSATIRTGKLILQRIYFRRGCVATDSLTRESIVKRNSCV